MQTQLADAVKKRPEYHELDQILRSCVHCGFCCATCPTYQLTGDELDGPRGRIYLMKQMLEGNAVTRLTQVHLDRCLTCRACETTCPSGVRYGRLLDMSRHLVAQKTHRPFLERWKIRAILQIFPYPGRFGVLLNVGRMLRPVLPPALSKKLPARSEPMVWPVDRHPRKMLILPGCVQPQLAPRIDGKIAQVLDQLGISLLRVKNTGCCGALSYHLADHQQAKLFAKQNIDACWPYVEQGVEAIVMSSSGCGVMVKEYDQLFQYDAEYREKANTIAALTKDISEILLQEDIQPLTGKTSRQVVFQSPCTLQHGQRLDGVVEGLLQKLGFQVQTLENAHLCCGSAGVYSLLQPDFARQLQQQKVAAIEKENAEIVVSANIGCINHLQSACKKPLLHWIELL